MEIQLDKISKRYGSQWVFRDLNFRFESGKNYALIGSNGAGKTTLLSAIVGKIPTTKGKINYLLNDRKIREDEVFIHFSIATTSMSVIEEFTLLELIKFHFRFRRPLDQLTIRDILDVTELVKDQNKFISNFSSGMKQRIKLTLALLSESQVIVLDEPGSNLDKQSKAWFQKMLAKYQKDRTVIIASNDPEDYASCKEFLDLSLFK